MRGASAIEFVGGFFAFWLMCMAWVEMSWVSYLSGVADLAIADTTRQVKTENEDYLEAFEEAINESGSLWSFFVDSENFRLSIEYLVDLEELEDTDNNCIPEIGETVVECGDSEAAIALYTLSYEYNSMFTYFTQTKGVISREMFLVQEYERTLN